MADPARHIKGEFNKDAFMRFYNTWRGDFSNSDIPRESVDIYLAEVWDRLAFADQCQYYRTAHPAPLAIDGEYDVIDGGPSKSRKVGEGWIPSPMYRLPGPQ